MSTKKPSRYLGGIQFDIGAVQESHPNALFPEEKTRGFYIKPTSNVTARPNNISNYLLASNNENGKVEWRKNNARDKAAAATTANIHLFSTIIVDGYVIQEGDRILVKDQTDKTENGIYVMESGVLVRAPDAQEGTSANDILIPVINGATYILTLWNCIDDESTLFGEETNWATVSGGGGGTPGLPLGSIQYNSGGLFAGSDEISATSTTMDFSLTSSLNFGSLSSISSGVDGILDVDATDVIIKPTNEFKVQNTIATDLLVVDNNDINIDVTNSTIQVGGTHSIQTSGASDIMTVNGSTEVVDILSGINSTSSTTGSLVITGGLGISQDMYAGGDVNAMNFNTLSDKRFKENINTLRNPLGIVENISGYTYNFINNSKPQVGFIAQEFEKDDLLKNMVEEDKDGVKRISYQQTIPILLECIKHLKEEVEDLKRHIRHNT